MLVVPPEVTGELPVVPVPFASPEFDPCTVFGPPEMLLVPPEVTGELPVVPVPFAPLPVPPPPLLMGRAAPAVPAAL
jgi:hypothetical protein